MVLPTGVKITKKNSHDKLWIKATLDKNNWFRIGVTRKGWRVTGSGNLRSHALIATDMFRKLCDAGFSYGDAIDYMELDLV